MKSGIATNFRGLRALVIHRDDMNRATLASVLGRLGIEATLMEPGAPCDHAQPACDLILFDADENIEAPWPAPCAADAPVIALIGNEAPSRLARVVRQRCDSHILKPIRTSGVFTALVLAADERARRRQTDREIDTLKQRLAGRRLVMKAVLRLMAEERIDEDAAYERLRQDAMNRRLPIEDLARERLGPEFDEGATRREARLSRKA